MKAQKVAHCRPRPICAAPEFDDVAALMILLRAQEGLVEQHKPADARGETRLVDFLPRAALDGFTKLNHAMAYIEDRANYSKLRAQLYAGIIEVS